jgi:GntR family transcriptional repressor for pyruvate dehydrogenase complex
MSMSASTKTAAVRKHSVISTGTCLERLRHYLVNQELRPGERLPGGRKLAADLGVSRPSLREATQSLTVLEVLVSRQGAGAHVKSLVNVEGGWPQSSRLEEIDIDVVELLEVWKMLEPNAAALAAARPRRSSCAKCGST